MAAVFQSEPCTRLPHDGNRGARAPRSHPSGTTQGVRGQMRSRVHDGDRAAQRRGSLAALSRPLFICPHTHAHYSPTPAHASATRAGKSSNRSALDKNFALFAVEQDQRVSTGGRGRGGTVQYPWIFLGITGRRAFLGDSGGCFLVLRTFWGFSRGSFGWI
jgi:hypothetical protein